jgi:cell division transport system permease protein
MGAPARTFRPRGADDLGLRRALSDRLLPLLVAAMAFLATLTCAGAMAAAGMAAHWRSGAAALVTVQVPQPDEAAPSGGARAAAVAGVLATRAGVPSHRLTQGEVAGLLRPWLGDDAARLAMALPAVFELRTAAPPPGLGDALERAAPGTLIERDLAWFDRLGLLAGSLQAVAALALAVVAFVAAAVIAVAARAGLATRRDAIEVVHGLGGTDGMIAGRFAARVTLLAAGGALLGVVLAIPVLLALARLAAPFQGVAAGAPDTAPDAATALLARLPPLLWGVLPAMPVLAAAIGWATTQATVRLWLRRLP